MLCVCVCAVTQLTSVIYNYVYRYHYFGLGIKSSSRYYTKDYTDKLEHGVGKKTPDKKVMVVLMC